MKLQKRHKARCYVLQALYQWHLTGDSVINIEMQFKESMKNDAADSAYFHRLFNGITDSKQIVDHHISPMLDREFNQLTPIELNILRLATYELMNCLEVPYRVILNEALEIAKVFGATDKGFKYVNGVLDKIAYQLRQVEIIHEGNIR